MGIFLRDRERRLAPTFPEPPIPPYPGASVFGGQATSSRPDVALQVPAVWACVSLLSNAVSMLPLETFRKTAGIAQQLPNPGLVQSPSAGMTQSEWLHMLMVSLLLRGNAFGRIVARDGLFRPSQIELLNPDDVTVQVDPKTGALTYRYRQQDLDATDVWHVRGFTLPGYKVGLSPISYAAAVIGLDLSSRRFAGDFFNGGGIPKAVVRSDANLSMEQARTVKERLLAATRSREPIVLPTGIDYTPISVKPEESQFLAAQEATVPQIARYFGVPAGMVGGKEGGSLTYSNVEQRSLDFLTYGVAFWLRRIEDAIGALLAAPQYVQFNVDALLRVDAETQAKIDVQRVASKVLVPSEIRARMNLPPMTDEQKAEADMVPLTVTPLGGAKALPALKEPPGPTAPVPAGDETDLSQQQNSARLALIREGGR